jgi:GT2 family glycosyltransferase
MNATDQPLPDVFVLAPVHNRRAITEKFVRNLKSQTYPNWHLILVDDGSTDGTAEMVTSLLPEAIILRGTGNWWWAGSLEKAYRWLRSTDTKAGSVIVIMNDDTEFDAGFLAAGVAALQPRSMLLARQYSFETEELLEVGVQWDWRTLICKSVKEAYAINCHPTRGLFFYFSVMVETGGFHPYLLPHYLSDYEYTIRARRIGFS